MPSNMMVGLMQWRHPLRTVEERDGNELFDSLQDHRNRKKARVAPIYMYIVVSSTCFLPLSLWGACSVGLRLC